MALYKRNRISAESYANFCVEFFDTSVDKPAPPTKQVITSKQVITPKQVIAPKQATAPKQVIAPKQNPVQRSLLPSQQALQHTPTSPPPSYTSRLHDSPPIIQTTSVPVADPSFTAELEAAPVKAKPVLLPPPTNSVTRIVSVNLPIPPPHPTQNSTPSSGNTHSCVSNPKETWLMPCICAVDSPKKSIRDFVPSIGRAMFRSRCPVFYFYFWDVEMMG